MPSPLTPLRVLWQRRRLEKACTWTRAALEAHQQHQLRRLRDFALVRSPSYRDFHRGLENRPLDELPILTKALMMERFDELITDRSVRLADAEAYLRTAPGARLFRNGTWCSRHRAAPAAAASFCSILRNG